jgi:predicted HAD superfamily hydrolase
MDYSNQSEVNEDMVKASIIKYFSLIHAVLVRHYITRELPNAVLFMITNNPPIGP